MNDFTELNQMLFVVSNELGKVVDFEEECPGVYYIVTINKNRDNRFNSEYEYYIVTNKATMISKAARAYGKQLNAPSVLLAYNMEDISSGKLIIEYEILMYKIKNNLPLPDNPTIQDTVASGRENHPDYFGAFPVPQETPWGRTVRYDILTNGLYWITTNTNQKALAVCYQMQGDFSSEAVNLSRLTDYGAKHGLDSTMGYMFFSEKDSCIPLFELLEPPAEWQNCINKAALMNAILEYHPAYAMMHNSHEIQGLNDHFGNLIKSLYGGFKLRRSEDNMILKCEQAGTKFLKF